MLGIDITDITASELAKEVQCKGSVYVDTLVFEGELTPMRVVKSDFLFFLRECCPAEIGFRAFRDHEGDIHVSHK